MSNQTLDQATQPAVLSNPFPGLRPFEFDESHLFFGRDGQSERLIAKLARTRFLAVVGTSGSGKSSLVRAGLLPALYSGFMPSAGSAWRVAVLRPGNDPLGNLARALNAPEVFGSEDAANRALQSAITEATLRRGSLGLLEAAREQQLPANENLLVVADQFEELFRVEQGMKDTEKENGRAAFVKLLLAARAQGEVNIYVVLTMRSDYLGDCAQFRDLPEAINDGQYLIPRLTREQIREAITGPIFVGGAEATLRLINRLLNDVGDNPDQLPILQHALMRTWNQWIADSRLQSADFRDNADPLNLQSAIKNLQSIDLPHYEAIGGMARALSLHTDEAFNELPDDRHRLVAERVFKALTEKGPDNREIRCPVMLGALCAVADATEAEVVKVIETFRVEGRSFLMPPVGTALQADSLIDISHESLMRNWLRLKEWVEDEAKSARIYRRLAETAGLYLEGKAGLWRDPDLQLALAWQAVARPNKHWAARYDKGYKEAIAFLEKSAAQRQADLEAAERQQREEAERTKRELAAAQALAEAQRQSAEAERLRAEEQAQAAGKLRRRAWAAWLLALLACLAAWFAYSSYRRAEGERATANEQRDKAQLSKTEADIQKGYALTAKADAEKAAKDAEEQKKKAEEKQHEAEAAKLAEELQRKLVAQQNEQLQASGKKLAESLTQSSSLLYVARGLLAQSAMDQQDYLRANDFLEASFPVPGTPAKDDLRSFDWFYRWRQLHDERAMLKGHTSRVYSVAFSSDGRTLASGSRDKTVKLWDVASGQEKTTLKGEIYSLAFSSDGQTLAGASADGTVKLWDIANGRERATPKEHSVIISSVAFSPDGRTLASGNWSGMVELWDAVSGRKKMTLKGHASEVMSMAFSPDGQTLASGSYDETVKMWDMASGQEKATLKGHTDKVLSVAFSPDGRTLASGSADNTVKLWDVASRQEKATLKGHVEVVRSVAFSPDGRMLASGSVDGAVKLWDVISGQEKATLQGHKDGVMSVAFAPDGRTLASGSNDGTVKLWDVVSRQEKMTLQGHEDRVLSVAFSSDERTLASGDFVGTVKLWDVASGRKKATLQGHKDSVMSVAFVPDGRTLASGSADSTLKLWDVASGQEKATLKGHLSRVNSVAFAPDGRTLASGSDDKIIRLYFGAKDEEVARQRNK